MQSFIHSNELHGVLNFLGTPAALLAMLFPWMINKFPSLVKLERYKQFYLNISNSMQELIDEHKKDIDMDNPRDFIDCFLIEMENQEDDKKSLNVEDQEEKLRTILIDIFIVSISSLEN